MVRSVLRACGTAAAGVKTDVHGRTAEHTETVGLFAHGVEVHLEQAEANTADDAVTAFSERLADVVAHAAPRHPLVTGDWHTHGHTEGAHVYLTASRTRKPRQPPEGHSLVIPQIDVRPFAPAPRGRLVLELASAGPDVRLRASWHPDEFEPAAVDDVLADVLAALGAVRAGRPS